MKQYNWFKVKIVPQFPPPCIASFCEAQTFFVRCSKAKDRDQKVRKIIRKICHCILMTAFIFSEPKLKSLDELKAFLVLHGHDTDIEDTSFDAVINTALYFHFDQIYRIVLVEPASSCEACRYQEAGQDPHMVEGGCLYTLPSSQDEI